MEAFKRSINRKSMGSVRLNDIWYIEMCPKGSNPSTLNQISVYFELCSLYSMYGRKIEIKHKIYSPELGNLYGATDWYRPNGDEFAWGTGSCGIFDYEKLQQLSLCVDYEVLRVVEDPFPVFSDTFNYDILDPMIIGKVMSGFEY